MLLSKGMEANPHIVTSAVNELFVIWISAQNQDQAESHEKVVAKIELVQRRTNLAFCDKRAFPLATAVRNSQLQNDIKLSSLLHNSPRWHLEKRSMDIGH